MSPVVVPVEKVIRRRTTEEENGSSSSTSSSKETSSSNGVAKSTREISTEEEGGKNPSSHFSSDLLTAGGKTHLVGQEGGCDVSVGAAEGSKESTSSSSNGSRSSQPLVFATKSVPRTTTKVVQGPLTKDENKSVMCESAKILTLTDDVEKQRV